MTQPISNEEPVIFVIIRHGDKDGGVDPDLNARGVEQAKSAGDKLRALLCDQMGKKRLELIASTLKRSQQTAAFIGASSGIAISEIKIDDRIKEWLNEETSQMLADRMRSAIDEALAKVTDREAVPVFVSHCIVVQHYIKGMIGAGHNIRGEFVDYLYNCEWIVFQKEGDKITALGRYI
jgi:broad specificity phosphatase PhoE